MRTYLVGGVWAPGSRNDVPPAVNVVLSEREAKTTTGASDQHCLVLRTHAHVGFTSDFLAFSLPERISH